MLAFRKSGIDADPMTLTPGLPGLFARLSGDPDPKAEGNSVKRPLQFIATCR